MNFYIVNKFFLLYLFTIMKDIYMKFNFFDQNSTQIILFTGTGILLFSFVKYKQVNHEQKMIQDLIKYQLLLIAIL